MMPDIKDRVEKIFSLIKGDVDYIFSIKRSSPNPTFSYITGLTYGLFEGSLALIKRDGSINLITSGLDKIEDNYIEVFVIKNQRDFKEVTRNLTKDCSSIGFDGRYTTFSDYKMMKRLVGKKRFHDVSKELLLSRLKKDDYEINMIRKACRISDKIFEELIEDLKEGIKEKELALKIEILAKSLGGDDLSFKSIVAFGKNSAIPHHVSGNKKLKRNEIVLLDFGVKYRGYVSDMTRSFVYGKADNTVREMFEVVSTAQNIGRDMIKEGVKFEDVHKEIYNFIEKSKFKGKFIHSSGHTIGLEVHDGFSLVNGVKERFSNGVTFTIEPGIYLKSVGGIRIEDDFVFLNGRVRKLTHSPTFLEI